MFNILGVYADRLSEIRGLGCQMGRACPGQACNTLPETGFGRTRGEGGSKWGSLCVRACSVYLESRLDDGRRDRGKRGAILRGVAAVHACLPGGGRRMGRLFTAQPYFDINRVLLSILPPPHDVLRVRVCHCW